MRFARNNRRKQVVETRLNAPGKRETRAGDLHLSVPAATIARGNQLLRGREYCRRGVLLAREAFAALFFPASARDREYRRCRSLPSY